jgi:hypothetical protein
MTTQLKKQLLPWESKVFNLKTLKSVRKLYMIHFKKLQTKESKKGSSKLYFTKLNSVQKEQRITLV